MLARRVFARLALAGALLGGAGMGLARPPLALAADLDIPTAETQFLELLNDDRAARGLSILQPDPRLMELARWRSEDQLERNYLSHDIGGYTVSQLLRERQISYLLVGENLALNTFDETRTVTMAHLSLMDSATHRAVALRPEFNLVGVGIAVGPNRRAVFTQIFIQAPPPLDARIE